ncbi:cytochrome c oxidase accessory protein CcoG [Candidatus Parabeggiatoa sp. HSG14]|uniref:cytochrome c oxidase accessory protein CcoG n=1 Tax=Candidatus Parabeggiatoa sp. HSG14 TaxID=3055593 RepID=UPI0025A907CD|nr:cytochrome c oxidase accessory protein CcoG [Thiotrichales bacterium HSG14]
MSLYTKHEKIHPRIILGFFTRLKALSGFTLLGIYYTFPWLQWNGNQLVLFDLPARKFHFFGLIFWPQDFIYLALLLVLAAFALFFFTTLAGRLWCGFACPQTIWTDAFLWMERLVEGDRLKQIKLDKAPMSLGKFRIKVTKHTLWVIFSLFTGFTFVGFFVPIHELTSAFIEFNLTDWNTFWILFYGFMIYGNAGWMREQVCIYMCPYARFQSAMFDKNTMIVAYSEKRGESRGSRKRNSNYKEKGLGDCIDCKMCVQVCPTGIDIRDGMQYQCISCSACVDACNGIMDKMDYPRGLISYTTENALNGKPSRIFRPRIFVYGTILLAIFISVVVAISTRSLVQLDVIRDRNSLFRETPNGLIENIYRLRIMNIDEQPHTYTVTASGIDGLQLVKDREVIIVASGSVMTLPVRLKVEATNLKKRSSTVVFQLTAQDDPKLTISEEARFLGPFNFR